MQEQKIEVIFLLGNHDIPYMVGKPSYYSLVGRKNQEKVGELLFRLGTQVAFQLDDYLLSHAGYTKDYTPEGWHFEKTQFTSIPELELLEFQVGFSRGGQMNTGSPVWADFTRDLKKNYHPDFPKQIVGHTPVREIDLRDEVIDIDVFSLVSDYRPIGDGALLLYDEGELTVLPFPNWCSIDTFEKTVDRFLGLDFGKN